MSMPRPAVVVITWNRAAEALRTIAHTLALPEAPEVIVVDNGSTDGTVDRVARECPRARIVALRRNIGAAARNHGLHATNAQYVAFSDDDTLWSPGSLAAGTTLLETHPRIGVLCARVTVGHDGRDDPGSLAMAASLVQNGGHPGHAVISFMAGACLFRRAAFLDAGGFEQRFHVGGEEALLALDLAARGWQLVYSDAMHVAHHPSPLRDAGARRRMMVRNALWTGWMRRRWPANARQLLATLPLALVDPGVRAGMGEAFRGFGWALSRRRAVPAEVEAAWRQVERVLASARRPGIPGPLVDRAKG